MILWSTAEIFLTLLCAREAAALHTCAKPPRTNVSSAQVVKLGIFCLRRRRLRFSNTQYLREVTRSSSAIQSPGKGTELLGPVFFWWSRGGEGWGRHVCTGGGIGLKRPRGLSPKYNHRRRFQFKVWLVVSFCSATLGGPGGRLGFLQKF